MMMNVYVSSSERVLVVEDNEERISYFRKYLAPSTVILRNPQIAIDLLRAKEFEFTILFLDHDLPLGNGVDVARELASMKFNGRVLVQSSNFFGARRIQAVLQTAGVKHILCEFGNFEIRNSFEVSGTLAYSTDGKIDLGEID